MGWTPRVWPTCAPSIVRLNQEQGKTVLLSSMCCTRLSGVATHVLVLHQGQTVVAGAVHDLLACAMARVQLLVDEPRGHGSGSSRISWRRCKSWRGANNGHFLLSMAWEQVPLLNRHLVEAGVTVNEP